MTNLDTIRDAFEECGLYLEPHLYDDPEFPNEQYIDLPGGTRLFFDENGKFIEAI